MINNVRSKMQDRTKHNKNLNCIFLQSTLIFCHSYPTTYTIFISSDVNEINHCISLLKLSKGFPSYDAASKKVLKRNTSVHLNTSMAKINLIQVNNGLTSEFGNTHAISSENTASRILIQDPLGFNWGAVFCDKSTTLYQRDPKALISGIGSLHDTQMYLNKW